MLFIKFALESQALDAVQFLLDSGADPNMGDDNQMYVAVHLIELTNNLT
jgi:hypothetical protein